MRYILPFIIFIVLCPSANALELRKSTARVVAESRYVAHVKVVESYPAAGTMKGVYDYTVDLLENIKGELPQFFIVRIINSPGVARYGRGAEMIVLLGEKNSHGIYPLQSLFWGIIPVITDSNDEKILNRPLEGYGAIQRFTVKGFSRRVKRGR